MKYKYFKIYFILLFSLIAKEGLGQSEFCSEPISTDSMMNVEYWHSDPICNQGEQIKSYGKYHIEVKAEEMQNECGWRIIIRNWADRPFPISSEEGMLSFICEAKNSIGFWKPIEYKIANWCQTGWYNIDLKPTEFMEIYRPKYSGNFKTKIRFKARIGDFVFYSNSIKCKINKGQFEKPNWCTKENFLK